jgi:hypothetical protein
VEKRPLREEGRRRADWIGRLRSQQHQWQGLDDFPDLAGLLLLLLLFSWVVRWWFGEAFYMLASNAMAVVNPHDFDLHLTTQQNYLANQPLHTII